MDVVVDGRTLTLLLEGEFALLVVVLVLASTPILTTLFSRTSVLPSHIHLRLRYPLTFPLFFGISVFQSLFSCSGCGAASLPGLDCSVESLKV